MRQWGVRTFALLFALAALCGCFKDQTGSAGECEPGEAACACDEDRACGSGLVCVEPGVCVLQDCEPGTLSCTCESGACDDGLECNGLDACVQPQGTTSGMATTAQPVTSTTVDPATSTATTEPPTTTTQADTTSTTGSSSESGECPQASTEECARCVAQTATSQTLCTTQSQACKMEPSCSPAFNCAVNCPRDPFPIECLDGCCDIAPDVPGPWFDMIECGVAYVDCVPLCCGVTLPANCVSPA